MISYKDYEKQVYDWLMSKHNKNEKFTFSVRQKANKGAELNYFIGTEKSNYFSTTFWFIPVAYPGSSSDLINLVFKINKNEISYNIQFNQTKNPENKQNQLALDLIKNIRLKLESFGDRFSRSEDAHKMEFSQVSSNKQYINFESMVFDLEDDLDKIIPIVDTEIQNIKVKDNTFIAHRFSTEEQNKMFKKMGERFKNYKSHDVTFDLIDDTIEEVVDITSLELKNQPLNQILYGPPGTGKTYNSINRSLSILEHKSELEINLENRVDLKRRFDDYIKNGQIVFTTFHQSMSYEDFIEGIKPETKNEKVTYEIIDGVFKKLCKEASAKKISKNFDDSYSRFIEEVMTKGSLLLETPTHKKKFKVIINSNETAVAIPETEKGTNMGVTKEMARDYVVNGSIRDWKPYTTSIGEYIKKHYPVEVEDIANSNKKFVLIIDEINRGNVSQIFGELITLIEEDKRLGKDEALEVTLPYSKDKFGVPANLHIIGTMNTADRSVESLDSALRRRFSFEEMEPKPYLIKTTGKSGRMKGLVDGIDLEELLNTINTRIEKLIDKDHRIGHSYFLKVHDSASLHHSFKNEIIPLLEEYFFGDFGKIGLVLGSSFVEKINHTFSFAKFDEYDTDIQEDLKQKSVFKIRKETDWKFSEI
ncbi:McrB family protein [Flavobacterium crassostreae]|uniref:ATPase dynein-related AAA domain-containing protein n=1 Tax=Flavobacterium crassostreae TaxID=1763534 RepID=A0A1B9E959_9FLAO|nr:AAA family ATPase [Flavobacterium crassostreae]OCB78418.1 hypothetical protein LPBF_02515 [Flavobacterium crassostreae]